MANEKNLESHKIRTTSEAREKGRKGGIASGEKRRELKTLREYVTAALGAKTNINGEETSIKDAMMRSLVINAVKNNDLAAIKYIAELIGESPVSKTTVELTGKDGKDLNQQHISRNEARELIKEMGKEYGWDTTFND